MKGSIVKCCAELVKDYYGEKAWIEILEESGESKMSIRPITDVDDQTVFKIFESICKVLNISRQEAFDIFGEYWVKIYVPRIYPIFYIQSESAKQFIMSMDKVHEHVTSMLENANPPRFKIEEIDEKTIIVDYISKRNLIDLFIGLIKGVGCYYKTSITIKKLSENRVELTFE